MSVKELTPSVDQLSSAELDELEALIKERRAREWAEQIERDATEGKLDALFSGSA